MFYQPISHTADIGFKVWGNTLEELFSNAARAMTDCMVQIDDGIPTQTIFVQLKADSLEELLVQWLSEVLYHFETDGLLGLGFTVAQCQMKDFKATIHGIPWDPEKQPLKTQIKAVTFHEMKVEKKKDRYEVQVIVAV
ncbi:MAG: archease [Deltaproteobacteria bacterium]|nr:archease [Deltaproteobacteria bacterium]